MRAEVVPGHDVHNLYLRWEIVPEGPEKRMLAALGGPVALEIEKSCVVDQVGVKHPTYTIKVPIWPVPGARNLGQARFHDSDARRRFAVNLQDAVGTTLVDWLYEARPGSLAASGKEGRVLRIPEGTRPSPAAPTTSPTPA